MNLASVLVANKYAHERNSILKFVFSIGYTERSSKNKIIKVSFKIIIF